MVATNLLIRVVCIGQCNEKRLYLGRFMCGNIWRKGREGKGREGKGGEGKGREGKGGEGKGMR
jgi:hypothetical protein